MLKAKYYYKNNYFGKVIVANKSKGKRAKVYRNGERKNMWIVAVTALGVGGATVIGTLIGFCFTKVPHKWNDAIMGFAAGVMLAAAMLGLVIPAMDKVGAQGIWQVVLGIVAGVLFLNLMDKITPHLHHLAGKDALPAAQSDALNEEQHANNMNIDKVMLFVIAIAIHNLPEGIAAGVGFGTGDIGNAVTVALGIALQNIPEGFVLVAPMILAGVSKGRTFLIAAATGLVEVAGTFIGYFASTLSETLLPFLLSFAGGTMLYIVSDEMIPETHSHGYERMATYSLIAGFCLMIVLEVLL